MKFIQRLKELRKNSGFTQKQMATKIGVATVTYVKYERGENEPNIETLESLATIFNVSIDYLLGHTEEISSINYNFYKTFSLIETSIDVICEEFPEYRNEVIKLVTDFLNHCTMISFKDKFDLLYIKNSVATQLDDLYFKTSNLKESDISNILVQANSIRKNLDDYLTIIIADIIQNKNSVESRNNKKPYFLENLKD